MRLVDLASYGTAAKKSAALGFTSRRKSAAKKRKRSWKETQEGFGLLLNCIRDFGLTSQRANVQAKPSQFIHRTGG
jgi:hypothetical protein